LARALVQAQAQGLQQVRLALDLVEADILEVLGSPAADRVDTVDSPAAGKDTRQVVLVEVVVRIVGRPRLAEPLVAVVDLRQAFGAMCSHNLSI
jgi:hypothetical protein